MLDFSKKFKLCRVDKNNQIPQEFIDGKSILITHVQCSLTGSQNLA
jgi:hypothetical protein